MVDDLIKGRAVFDNAELDDLIIFRSDGVPTYNFATVLDDADFGITHVVRGDDHLPNTPRQMQIFFALGLDAARLCASADGDGCRTGRSSPSATARPRSLPIATLGYFPEALLNYLARLGWSHGDQEIFSQTGDDRVFRFRQLRQVGRDFQRRETAVAELPLYEGAATAATRARGTTVHRKRRLYANSGRRGVAEKMIATLRERAKTLVELVDFAKFYLSDDDRRSIPRPPRNFSSRRSREPLTALAQEIEALDGDFNEAAMQGGFERVLARFNLKLGQLAQPVTRGADRRDRQPGDL